MTTCAWDSTMVATDTMSETNCLILPANKMFRSEGKILMGSGDLGQIIAYWRQIKSMSLAEVLELGYPKYDPDKNCPGMILVDTNNPQNAWNICSSEWTKLKRKYHAIGSGRDFAIAAMYLGKTAREAVQIAAEFDIYTGGEIEHQVLTW